MQYIKDLKENSRISAVYMLKSRNQLLTKTGRAYESLSLQDKTGVLSGKIWDPDSSGIEDVDAPNFVEVMGDIVSFNGALQLNIRRIRKADEGAYDPSDYTPASEYNRDEMFDKLKGYIGKVENPYLKQVLNMVFFEDATFEKRFKNHSAAKSVHHGFVGGLVEHTLSVVELCAGFAEHYPLLNKDLLISAAALHDIGKLYELSGFPENDYTDEGQLLGHIMIGVEIVGDCIKKIDGFPRGLANELKHCIIAHHGELEFGSPKKPAIPEAVALHFADNLDAKMETMKEVFANAQPGAEWVGYNKFLDSNIRRTGK
ncbi:MAG: HD domain-containing protein [Lachnospiraceae bacterium]|nr:HD domain-containing protein [Lachnospiraceae bacterium]